MIIKLREEINMENVQAVIENTTVDGLVECVIEKEQDTIVNELINDEKTSESKTNEQKHITKPKSSDKSRTKSVKGVASAINSKANGKRFTLSKELMELLGNPESVEIGFTDIGIVLSKKLPENGAEFRIRKCGNKGVIYSSSLVQEITEQFDLDFSDKVSITFVDAEELEVEGDYKVFEIKIK
jgi:hypothetical protein